MPGEPKGWTVVVAGISEERSRKDLLELIIGAVECAQGEAVATHDENYVRLCEEVMFPFLEGELFELARASRICMVGSRTDDPCTRVAVVSEEGREPTTCLYHAMLVELRSYRQEIAQALAESEDMCAEAIRSIVDEGTYKHWELL